MSIPRLKCVTYVHPKQLSTPLLPSLLQSNLPAAPIIRVKVQPWKVKVKVVKMFRTVLENLFVSRIIHFDTVDSILLLPSAELHSSLQGPTVYTGELYTGYMARHTGELYTSDRHCSVVSCTLAISGNNC